MLAKQEEGLATESKNTLIVYASKRKQQAYITTNQATPTQTSKFKSLKKCLQIPPTTD
jgi:hypothetical protein